MVSQTEERKQEVNRATVTGVLIFKRRDPPDKVRQRLIRAKQERSMTESEAKRALKSV